MRLVEQHVIRDTDSRYAAIDRAAFASKNLYNAANFIIEQPAEDPWHELWG